MNKGGSNHQLGVTGSMSQGEMLQESFLTDNQSAMNQTAMSA